MNLKKKSLGVAIVSAAIIIGTVGLASSMCSNKPSTSTKEASKYTKTLIQKLLKAEKNNIYYITWSPDSNQVVYSKEPHNIYIWTVGQRSPKFVKQAEDTTTGFSWSPDSRCFLINVWHMGPSVFTSHLVDVNNIRIVGSQFTSVSSPVWSADSKCLALSTDDEHKTTQIMIYSLEKEKYKSILKKKQNGGAIAIKYWNKNGYIGYTENNKGKLINKKIKAVEF